MCRVSCQDFYMLGSWDRVNDLMKDDATRRQRLQEIEKKREDAREKKSDSEAAFKGWLAKKASLAAEARTKGTRKVVRGKGSAEKDRSDASRKAYEDWLDIIEQRELEDKYAEEERLVRSLWRPPWYPGGITQD